MGLTVALVLRLALAGPAVADDRGLPPAANRAVDYAKDIQPILQANCYQCHGPKKQQSEFRLDQKARALKGGSEGPAIVPGKGAESPLIERVASQDPELAMPPKGERLTPEQIGLLRAWIDQGASWPDELASAGARAHWAFQAPRRPSLPTVGD
jgi:mono/diheme cytochrome c family protein